MTLFHGGKSGPGGPGYTVRTGHEAVSTGGGVMVFGEEANETTTRDVPGLHIRKVGDGDIFIILFTGGRDEDEMVDVVWFLAFVDVGGAS